MVDIVGQDSLLEQLATLPATFPSLLIIIGPVGAGKKLIARRYITMCNAQEVSLSCGIDSIREGIRTAYQQTERTIYTIFDADTMRVQAKNAMLKVAEEPPNNAAFVMTVSSVNLVLPTILSRAFVVYTAPYSEEVLRKFGPNTATTAETAELVNFCATPGELLSLSDDYADLLRYAKLTATEIGAVTLANAFKISTKLKLKEADENAWEPMTFVKAVRSAICQTSLPREAVVAQLQACNFALYKLGQSSLSKLPTIDEWLYRLWEVQNGIK
jgi:replication-associated recombination protein RarA